MYIYVPIYIAINEINKSSGFILLSFTFKCGYLLYIIALFSASFFLFSL